LPGQIVELGRHRLFCGDATDWPFPQADYCLTDPPFDFDGRLAFDICYKSAKNFWAIAGCGTNYHKALAQAKKRRCLLELEEICLRQTPQSLAGRKLPAINHWVTGFLKSRTIESCLRHPRETLNQSVIGPWKREIAGHYSKPMEWALEILQACDGRVVSDPFAGTGTVLMAADKLGLTCFSAEIDPGKCDLIRARWNAAHAG